MRVAFKVNKSLLAGAISAVLCATCLALYLGQVNGEVENARAEALARYGGEQIEVLVANRDIASGEVVGESMVDQKMWIADLLPEGALTQRSDVVGKRLGSSVLAGEVISSKRLYESASDLDIPLGLTAVSIPVKDVQAVGGALDAGMTADVYATGSSATTLLIEDALVLATSTAEADSLSASSVSWITLAVDPSAVAELVAAAQNLELYLTLPNDPVGVVSDDSGAALGASDETGASSGLAADGGAGTDAALPQPEPGAEGADAAGGQDPESAGASGESPAGERTDEAAAERGSTSETPSAGAGAASGEEKR